jgi:DNA-directed RNA polymerase specialized sigma24 family protein
MAHLSERQRELLALKYGAAINNRLIAKITGLTEGLN